VKPARALQRQWYAKLGPDILDEGPDGEGQLSDRGHLHPIIETPEEDRRLAERTEDGAAYTAWAESVLHHGPKLPPQEARVWRMHAQGMGERDIGTALTITRRTVRGHLARTRKRVSKVSKGKKRWRNAKRQRATQFRALVSRCDPRILAKLAAVMMRQLARSSPSSF